MSIRNLIKRYLPSYRVEERLMEEIKKVRSDIHEMDDKNEYLYFNAWRKEGESFQDARARIEMNMPKATGRLRNIQLAENYILQRVKKICDENGLHVFLVGGTLLGAMRHGGFIPWDNDIDVGMMKSDYLKLRKILESDEEILAEYCYNYAEGLRMSKVKFKDNDFFWIDILVFDQIDVNEEELESVWKATQKANLEYGNKIREYTINLMDKHYWRPVENHELDLKMAEYEESHFNDIAAFGKGEYFCEPIDCPYWSRNPRGIMKYDDYYPLLESEMEFEGMKYDVWKNYEQAIYTQYGDIWKLPSSVNEPHTGEFDYGEDEAMKFLKDKGILSGAE